MQLKICEKNQDGIKLFETNFNRYNNQIKIKSQPLLLILN